VPDARARAAFAARPIAQAARELARDTDWTTAIKFFRELADQAKTEQDFVLLEDFAHSIGRRDLGVIGGQAAENLDIPGFRAMAFPLMPVPAGANWTIDHAITRQESQFSQYAISRAGARGLMQLMPATAADQARKLGIAYSPSTLSSDPQANLQLGDAYFARVLAGFNGSYPLAIAAYNAGGGNVRKWLAARGDPRGGSTDNWVDWIEKIPFSETRGYVQHVLENAVVYEAMNPSRAKVSRGSTPLSHFIKVPAPMPVTPLPPAPVDSAPADGFVSQPVVQQIPRSQLTMRQLSMRVLGAVLAGGRSSRFGSDKALALLEGEPARPCAGSPLPFCAEVVVCGHPHPGARVLADRPAPDMGPGWPQRRAA
jgi:soluble lytic murein transglycosylase